MKNLKRFSNRYFHDYQERLLATHVEAWLKDIFEKCLRLKSFSEWEALILHWNEIKAHIETHLEMASLAFHRHTEDEAVEAEERRLREEIEPPYKEWNAKIREKILSAPERTALEKKLGTQYFNQLQIQQDAFAPKNIVLETQVNQILADYTKLTGSAQFELRGQKYPLAHYKKFSVSPEASLRKESFDALSAWFLNHRLGLDDTFDQCIALRNQMARELGHENYIPLAYQKLRRTDYGPREVAEFRKQILEVVVPITQKIREHQAKSLAPSPVLRTPKGSPSPLIPPPSRGRTKGGGASEGERNMDSVFIWDADFFPEWRVDQLKIEIPDQATTGLKVYQTLSPQLGDHFQEMITHELMDVPARNGKAPGAFCTDFADYRVPFIFLNSVGQVADITTLLHESGHAFQAWESQWIDLLELRWPTLEACEVHSMGMEFLAHPYYEEFLFEEDAKRVRKYHVAESLILLPYIAVVDEFQHRVYRGEAKGPKGREEAWEDLEKTYLPSLDFGEAASWRRIRWQRQIHIFKHPFYYIDYAIALTGALQLWVQSIKNPKKAIENYLKLCHLGGTLPLREFFKAGGLKIPFEAGVLKELMDEVMRIEPIF